MKKIDAASLKKMGIALLIAALLIAFAAIAVEGWEGEQKEQTEAPAAVDFGVGDPQSNDEKQPEDQEDEQIVSPSKVVPAFLNEITGLETAKDEKSEPRYAVVVDPEAPLYGISSADLTIEIPVEDGKTRLVLFPGDTSVLGKIGALSKSRSYIETAVRFFGGIPVYYGKDDSITSYPSFLCKSSLDLSEGGFCYMENAKYAFTSGENVEKAKETYDLDLSSDSLTLPYGFCDYYADPILGNATAESVTLPYRKDGETLFVYSSSEKNYTFKKGGKTVKDQLTGRDAAFTNLFVLFADGMIYSRSFGRENVTDVISGGSGYYISHGTRTEIRWSTDKNGKLQFKELSGDPLTVNRGSVYIGYYSSADSYDVTFS